MKPELRTLIKARALLADPEKWGKGEERYDAGTLCIMDALWDGPKTTCGEVLDACDVIRQAAGLPPGFADWNDAPERTHADVLAALDKAIASLSAAKGSGA